MRLLAPTWYVQVAPLAAGGSRRRPAATTQAASQERLKRELLAFLEELSRPRPLVVFLDDVHWADASTVDLLAYLGARCAGLRLLLLLTYRPSDLLLGQHPFGPVKLELQRHGVCREMPLGFLGRDEVERYLALAFPGHRLPAEFAAVIHAKTEGNPLFLVDLLRYLRDRGVIAEGPGGWGLAEAVPDFRRELPESVRSLIQRKVDQLGEVDRRLLLAASVQGYEFDSAVVARVLDLDAADVEERLEVLERVHGLVRLRREQEFPDGTLVLRYHFVHVLYQNALYAALQPTRRAAYSAAVARALAGPLRRAERGHRGRAGPAPGGGAGLGAGRRLLPGRGPERRPRPRPPRGRGPGAPGPGAAAAAAGNARPRPERAPAPGDVSARRCSSRSGVRPRKWPGRCAGPGSCVSRRPRPRNSPASFWGSGGSTSRGSTSAIARSWASSS